MNTAITTTYTCLGNSLGGHVALVHILKNPERIKTLTLTGSSGLFENGMGDTYPKRGDKEYIRKKTEFTFYDPAMATEELVDEVFEITNNRLKSNKNNCHWLKVLSAIIWAKN